MILASEGPFIANSIEISGSPSSAYSAWSNPNNISGIDNQFATVSFSGTATNQYSDTILATNFNFTIPSGATIQGVKVSTFRTFETSPIVFAPDIVVDKTVRLLYNGNFIGENKTKQWEYTSSQIYDYGGEYDTWSTNITKDMVKSSGFGVAIQTSRSGNLINGEGYKIV